MIICKKPDILHAAERITGSDCLDLFAAIGALRNAEDQEIVVRFSRAYAEDRDLAMKMLFYSRDIRSGLGIPDDPEVSDGRTGGVCP